MRKSPYGTVEQYRAALASVLREDIPPNRMKILRHHFDSPNRTATASELAAKVGYKTFGGANLQYGLFAREVASRLGVTQPHKGFWLHVLIDWADDHPSGQTAFVLRPEVVKALQLLGPAWVP